MQSCGLYSVSKTLTTFVLDPSAVSNISIIKKTISFICVEEAPRLDVENLTAQVIDIFKINKSNYKTNVVV